MGIFYNPARKYMQNGKSYVTAGRAIGSTIDANATAEGINNIASGEAAHAEGKNNTASGKYSHAQGINTTASGEASTALGTNTTASETNQIVLGKYNVADSDAIIIIGNGSSSAPKNILRVDAITGNVTDSFGRSLIIPPPMSNGIYIYKFLNGIGSWVSPENAGIGVWSPLPE